MFLRFYLKTLHVKYVRDETGSTLWSECSLAYVMCLHLHRKLKENILIVPNHFYNNSSSLTYMKEYRAGLQVENQFSKKLYHYLISRSFTHLAYLLSVFHVLNTMLVNLIQRSIQRGHRRWNTPCTWIGRINIVKMTIPGLRRSLGEGHGNPF